MSSTPSYLWEATSRPTGGAAPATYRLTGQALLLEEPAEGRWSSVPIESVFEVQTYQVADQHLRGVGSVLVTTRTPGAVSLNILADIEGHEAAAALISTTARAARGDAG